MRIRTLTTVAALLTSAIATIPAAPAQAAAGRTTELTVVYRADAGCAQTQTMHLHCNPDGGDQPRVAEACDDLAALDADRRDPFAPPSDDQVCAVEYDGPQTAPVVRPLGRRTGGLELQPHERVRERPLEDDRAGAGAGPEQLRQVTNSDARPGKHGGPPGPGVGWTLILTDRQGS